MSSIGPVFVKGPGKKTKRTPNIDPYQKNFLNENPVSTSKMIGQNTKPGFKINFEKKLILKSLNYD